MNELIEMVIEKLQEMVKQCRQDEIKNNKTPQIINLKRHRNNLVNSERTSTNFKVRQRKLQKKKYEIKKIAQIMKKEFNKDMENLRKKNQTEILEIKISLNQTKNTVESHSSRLE
jgi:type VI protein secretion system component VasA